eukprot:1195157-Prorocentrum_minimum.AAC.3
MARRALRADLLRLGFGPFANWRQLTSGAPTTRPPTKVTVGGRATWRRDVVVPNRSNERNLSDLTIDLIRTRTPTPTGARPRRWSAPRREHLPYRSLLIILSERSVSFFRMGRTFACRLSQYALFYY